MTEQNFRIVRKGYDPTEVNQALAASQSTVRRLENQLTVTNDAGVAAAEQAKEQQQVIDDLSLLSTELQRELQETKKKLSNAVPLDQATFDHLGDRIKLILNTAQEEATAIRATAQEEAEAALSDAQSKADHLVSSTKAETDDARSKAEAEATRMVEEAKKRADDIREQVDSEASAAREEAAALLESQRTSATAAAIDFEKTLSQRREEALESLDRDVAVRHEELNDATTRLNEARAEAQRTEFEARERAEQIVRAAEQRSNEVLSDSQIRAEAIRQNADRELTAALARRDSINEQLASVRQMLSAYGSPAAAEIVDITDASEVVPVPEDNAEEVSAEPDAPSDDETPVVASEDVAVVAEEDVI